VHVLFLALHIRIMAVSPSAYAVYTQVGFAPEDLLAAATDLARSIAENGRLGTWMTIRGMWANLETGSLAAAIELENRTQILIRGTGSLEEMAIKRGFMKKP